MNIEVFTKYWQVLKREYQDKQHNTQDLKLYYSIFKEYPEKEFKQAIKQVLKYENYFPRINEIVKYLPTHDLNSKVSFDKDGTMLWGGIRCESEKPSKEELKMMNDFLKNKE